MSELPELNEARAPKLIAYIERHNVAAAHEERATLKLGRQNVLSR
jgi:hypothetical protein